jgi:transposase-like protein
MKRWSLSVQQKARQMRLQGATFREVIKELGVPKSTLSLWVQDIPHPNHIAFTNQKEWLTHIREFANQAKRQKREEQINEIVHKMQKEVATWNFLQSLEAKKALLSVLYWAEGQKLPEKTAPVKFANTDPKLVLLFVTLLKNCYTIDPKKIKVMLYLHWYHKTKEVKQFWKDLLEIDESQFRKVYHKKRSKTKRYRKNFMGICFVIYQSVHLRHEIVATDLAVQQKVINAPVA